MFGSPFGNDVFDDVRRLEAELSQILTRSPYSAGIRAVPRGTYPPINVGATPEQVDVYVFVPGVDANKVEVSVQQNLLTISGSRDLAVDSQADYYRHERFQGEFHRVIALPDDANPDLVDARYRDGVLHVTVKRRQPAKPRQVQIR